MFSITINFTQGKIFNQKAKLFSINLLKISAVKKQAYLQDPPVEEITFEDRVKTAS